MQQHVFIFGATGYMGSHLVNFFKHYDWTVSTDRVDIRDYSAVKNVLLSHRPDVVINAAAYKVQTNVDEFDEQKTLTMGINVAGAINIACVCEELGLYFVHLGTGCIYDGNNHGEGFRETDPANFFGSFYSRTKAIAEKALEEFHPLQLRIRIPIEGRPHRKNVIDKLVKYQHIISIENSFSVVEDFLPAAYQLIQRRERGIFNMTNVGSMDHAYLMTKYQEIVNPNYTYNIISLEELKKYAKVPRSNTVLNTVKREQIGVHMPPIKERIIEILREYKTNLARL